MQKGSLLEKITTPHTIQFSDHEQWSGTGQKFFKVMQCIQGFGLTEADKSDLLLHNEVLR